MNRDYTENERRDIKSRLLDLGAVSVRWWNMAGKLEKPPERLLTTVEPSRNLFKSWLDIDKKGSVGLDLEILDRAHTDVVHEGDELYSVEATEE